MLFFFFFLSQVSLECPGTHCVYQASLGLLLFFKGSFSFICISVCLYICKPYVGVSMGPEGPWKPVTGVMFSVVVCLFDFGHRTCSPCCHEILRDPSASASWVLGFKACTTMPGPCLGYFKGERNLLSFKSDPKTARLGRMAMPLPCHWCWKEAT